MTKTRMTSAAYDIPYAKLVEERHDVDQAVFECGMRKADRQIVLPSAAHDQTGSASTRSRIWM